MSGLSQGPGGAGGPGTGISLATRVALHGLRLNEAEVAALEHALAGLPGPVYLHGARAAPPPEGEPDTIALLAFASGVPEAVREGLRAAVLERFASRCDTALSLCVLDPDAPSPDEQRLLAEVQRTRLR